MEYEQYIGLKKGKDRILEQLYQESLKRSWFLCYQMTRGTAAAAPLLITAWVSAVRQIREAKQAPNRSFQELLFAEILSLFQKGVEPDADYAQVSPPQVAEEYQPFVEEIQSLSEKYRPVYLMNVYGGLSSERMAEIMEISPEQTAEWLQAAQNELSEKTVPSENKKQRARSVQLFTAFRNPSGSGFQEIQIPGFLRITLRHQVAAEIFENDRQERKETDAMTEKTVSQTKKVPQSPKIRRRTKRVIVWTVLLVAVILAAIFLPRFFGLGAASASSITTYHAEAVSYGDVNTTISGSGTLTPVSRDTLMNSEPATVTAVNFTVGDTAEAGSVIASLEGSSGQTIEITAPYDCVLLELPVAAGEELDANSEVAMVMGTDGFTMGIAVDESDISTVAIGQEVTFSIDAVDGEYTGEVTAISYNGSTSGSTTAYQITAEVDYVEGVYPGMSASAEIVIESSGEGLLVPVDAVQTSGDDNYLYLAPDSAEEGSEYAENEIDVSSLSRVTVTTGMSDGSYILVESDEIAEGTLILVPRLTSTQTGQDSEETGGMGGFGGSPDGGFPGGGGMEFGDFDFENFDPGNMPQGGGGPGLEN